jgi:hypothetical protein
MLPEPDEEALDQWKRPTQNNYPNFWEKAENGGDSSDDEYHYDGRQDETDGGGQGEEEAGENVDPPSHETKDPWNEDRPVEEPPKGTAIRRFAFAQVVQKATGLS